MDLYTNYQHFLSRYFSQRVQKLPVDVGATCPVRDGSIASGGCTFCNAVSYVPAFADKKSSITEQLKKGKLFFKRRMPKGTNQLYLAYFQAGSNTYLSVDEMRGYVSEALAVDGVVGVVIATRPDCLSDEWVDYLQGLRRECFVMVELGVESVCEEVLANVKRGHTVEDSKNAILKLAAVKIPICVHMILGLPGDSEFTMLAQADFLSSLPVDVVKLHQLQILKGSLMASDYAIHPDAYRMFTPSEYINLLVRYIERLHGNIAIERFVSQAPVKQLIAPRWNMKNDDVEKLIVDSLRNAQTYQGKMLLHS